MFTIFETFVGAGGAHIGFKQEGFESKYINDINDKCIETILYNNPEIKQSAFVDTRSILDINPHDLLERVKMNPKEADVFFGGIVCKGFSMAGERCPNDERNYFYHKQLELISVIKPKISIIENVPGLINAEVLSDETPLEVRDEIDELWKCIENYKGKKAHLRKIGQITEEFELEGKELRLKKEKLLKNIRANGYLISVIDDITRIYDKIGYDVYHKVLNSAWYGAATKRERIIIVAVRKDVGIPFEFPIPTHMDQTIERGAKEFLELDGVQFKKPKTVFDALNEIDYSNKDDLDNIPMNHNEKTVERFKYIPAGDSIAKHIDKLPDDLKISKFYSRGSTMRLAGDTCSPTLVPGHSNFPVHPTEHRSITVREAAAITGFPLDYKFFGSHSKRCEHVGNAVPPALSRALAKSCCKLLNQYYAK
ncbi:DNA cytosine methyltransferase [Turicibacter sanguinis]|uniref:DNA cytosine methyltransferase n=1 Tax=Turicibacter sanguinis TaxID=154288 RepID=UPI0018AB7281|nr:DNA cytosine methyltransferase [Turicibacter sanguinis]MDB8559260.1 DNA cytosine methyltransferase [Turicibacter sanguinis]